MLLRSAFQHGSHLGKTLVEVLFRIRVLGFEPTVFLHQLVLIGL